MECLRRKKWKELAFFRQRVQIISFAAVATYTSYIRTPASADTGRVLPESALCEPNRLYIIWSGLKATY
jgi:hypothetical protein